MDIGKEDREDLSEESEKREGRVSFSSSRLEAQHSPRLGLHSIEHGDDSIGVQSRLLDRCGEADEADEAVRELLRLARLKTSEEEHEDGVGHVLADRVAVRDEARSVRRRREEERGVSSQRDVFEDGLEKLKAVGVVGFAGDEVLEDTKHGSELVGRNDVLSSPGEERPQKPDESGHVSLALPQGRGEQWREESLVGFGEIGSVVKLEELGEDLENEGGEFGDVLLEDGLEGRE